MIVFNVYKGTQSLSFRLISECKMILKMSLYVLFLGYNSYKWIKNSKFARKNIL